MTTAARCRSPTSPFPATCAQDGGGIGNGGTLSLTNCTLSGNTAFSNPFLGGGNGGGVYNAGTLSVTNCTLSGNTVFSGPFGGGGSGGGIYNAAALALNNSIVANSPEGGDISGGYSGGHNLIGELVGTVALGDLADNGGPTPTMALPAGSPAINAADPALAPATDQRGFARDALPDIGAFEAGAVPHLLVVTTLADEDDGDPAPWRGAGTSLREAIAFANQNPGADTITFAVSGTISLNGSQLPTITDDLTITGPSGGVTLDAGGASRIFQVSAGATASLTGLTLANGQAGGDTGSSLGGGIYNQGTLSLADCTLSGNSAIYGGGVDNSGTMSLTNVTLSGNGALDSGGGIDNGGTMSLTNVTLSGNGAQDGGGIGNGGTLSLTNCTLSGNTAFSNPFLGGGNGGGVYNAGTLSVTNCTLSGNTVFSGPFGGGGSGGGIYNAAALALNNSIVANSPEGGDISGGYSGGHNLFGEVALGPLADNGGPTPTMALPAGSPAIDAGDSTAPGLPCADQRGFARLSGAAVDVGAFEVQEPLFNTTALPDGTYGTPYSNTITATATGGAVGPFTFAVTAGTLPPGLSLTTGGALSGTPTAAGSFSFTVTATDSDSDTGSQGYTLTIDKAALTITADNQTRIQGEANPPFKVSYSGFVLGEGPGVLGGTLTFSTPATAGSAPGSYAVTPAGLTSGNYAITFVSGTLTVLGYGQATSDLQARVDAAGLAQGMRRSLDSQLQAAVALFNAGDTAGGVSQLGAFISHVSAQRGKHIAAALADAWVASAQRIIDAAG